MVCVCVCVCVCMCCLSSYSIDCTHNESLLIPAHKVSLMSEKQIKTKKGFHHTNVLFYKKVLTQFDKTALYILTFDTDLILVLKVVTIVHTLHIRPFSLRITRKYES